MKDLKANKIYYQTELCNLDDPEEAKFWIDFMKTCTKYDYGVIGDFE